MVNVTKTYLPSRKVYEKHLDHIWESKWLTNRGKLVQKLAIEIQTHLNSSEFILTNNGTIPLQIALKILGQKGEIITTPFSYIATSAAIVWENCTPVFVDIHPEYLTIDEEKIEEAITNKTTAILATHVFGNPCAIDEIEKIAAKHHLFVIYDAAHCFGVNYQGQSIFNYGDISTCSFHATKIFHTGEGGAIFATDKELLSKLAYHGNFGHKEGYDFHGLGINAKMSELHAAMGLSVLPDMKHIFSDRKRVIKSYHELVDFDKIKTIKIRDNTEWNYSYFPVVFEDEDILLKVVELFEMNDIFAKRYFYPALNQVNYLKGQNMPVAESIAERILCLPLFVGLPDEKILEIANLMNSCLVTKNNNTVN